MVVKITRKWEHKISILEMFLKFRVKKNQQIFLLELMIYS